MTRPIPVYKLGVALRSWDESKLCIMVQKMCWGGGLWWILVDVSGRLLEVGGAGLDGG